MTASLLKKGGSPFKIIFGLTLPQIKQIARESTPSARLATQLWNNSTTRCSMLLAPMLMPPEEFPLNMALEWAAQSPAEEVTDILCKELLVKTSYAQELVDALFELDSTVYAALRLMLNLMRRQTEIKPEWRAKTAEATNASTPGVRFLALQIVSELGDHDEARH